MSTNRTGWYRIHAAADDKPAEVFIYDRIGETYWGDGVGAKNFTRELADIDADAITVRINSPGGSVYDGIAILNALREHKATITVHVDGLAASAASFIAMAGDEIIMSRNAEMMIHDPMMGCAGNADDMRAAAERLEQVGENVASIYAERAGGDAKTWRTAMRSETWYSAQEAVDAGLADKVAAAKRADTDAKNAFDLSIFNYAGRSAAPTPPPAPPSPSAAKAEVNNTKEDTMSTLIESLRERLGVNADADEATVLAAIDEALAEQAETGAAGASNTADTVTVDRAQWETTVAEARSGQQARVQQLRDADEALVDAAIRDGKFGPARREHWLTALAADRDGATQAINSLAKGLVPLEEIGHGQNSAETTDSVEENDLFKNWSI
ncbi:head maturation protease, ClpP-related [Prescottella equi]|uniref:head maturation protease, ClpP-related n=1 Tax=Rhodococcus hoagii TaxID=43767 RepID=UPI000A25536B|nr:head maturation protease, ClpP-related [Prescottella equi]NKS97489.1 hypothetical protein [Prescottella equi]ORM18335.1 hypothetical protein A5N74_12070 [Prescottella equi]